MDPTVARIVDILFQNAVMNADTQALHDEVMTNCQDRYSDLIAQGRTPDEAIACVIDSLRGLEDVIASCPRRQTSASAGEGGERTRRFPAGDIRLIAYDVSDADVALEAVDGADVEVSFDADSCQGIELRLDNGELRITGRSQGGGTGGGWLSRLLSQVGGRSDIRLGIPRDACPAFQARLASGDVRAEDVTLSAADIATTGGDIELRLPSRCRAREIVVNSASGDVTLDVRADTVSARSMSGDIRFDGECRRLTATSVSGDVTVQGDTGDTSLKTVSGDLSVEGRPASVRAATTSGDAKLRLDAPLLRVRTSTVSGSVRGSVSESPDGLPVDVSTVSGDITIQRGC